MKNEVTNNSNGFSLLEITIAIGALGGIALLLTQLTARSNKVVARMDFSLTALDVKSELTNYRNNMIDHCTCLMQGTRFNAGSISPTSPILLPVPAEGFVMTRYSTPGDCSSGTPLKVVARTDLKIDKARVSSINASITGGSVDDWSGKLLVSVEAGRKVFGARERVVSADLGFVTQDVGVEKEIVKCVEAVGASGVAINQGSVLLSGPGVGNSITPTDNTTKSFVFPGVPSDAKAVIISYLLGRESGGDRELRYCKITPDNIILGHRSSGDGKAKMIGGTATIPYNTGSPQSIHCFNEDSFGGIKVIGVIY